MQSSLKFDIEKKSDIEKTFRVSKIMCDFDLKEEHSNEHFIGEISCPPSWNIGVIVGNSGTGKTTIAKQLFGNRVEDDFEYTAKSVIDDMPNNCSIEDICKMFYAVGFGSVPSWLKPYHVLSNGEKMRVDLARKLLQDDFIVFDEFTSVVDRRVAETMCIATNKAVKRLNKQIIVVSCHYDILNWLQPDWVFDTNEMNNFFIPSHESRKNSLSNDAALMSDGSLGSIII